MKIHRPSLHPSGLTLLELLVVLTILVALSTVAITSTSGVADQARYEATQRTLENVKEAILGPPNMLNADGSPLRIGFVADMGRLPQASPVTSIAGGTGTGYTLNELWAQGGMAAYEVRISSNDPEIRLGTGWRGPYVQFAPGDFQAAPPPQLRDGWGVEFATRNGTIPGFPNDHLLDSSGNPVVAGTAVAQVVSFGMNDLVGGSGTYDRPLPIVINDSDFTVEIFFQVQLRKLDPAATFPVSTSANFSVVVGLFGPDPSTGLIRFIYDDYKTITSPPPSQYVSSRSPNALISGFGTNTLTFSTAFTRSPTDPPLTVGPRVLRAYYSPDSATPPVTSGTSVPKSSVSYFTALPGQNFRTLVINVP